MKKRWITTCIVLASCLLGFVSLAQASEGKSSIKFYIENVAPEDEEEAISDKEESLPENNSETESNTPGIGQSQLPQTNFRQSKIMMIIGNLVLIFVLLIIIAKERRKRDEKI